MRKVQITLIVLFVLIILYVFMAPATRKVTQTTSSQTLESDVLVEATFSDSEFEDSIEVSTSDLNIVHLFTTGYRQDYVDFLANFDFTQYEILDISTSMNIEAYGSDEFYMVTYMDKKNK